MVMVRASIEAKSLKKFTSLSDQMYINITAEGNLLVFSTGSAERKAFMFSRTDSNLQVKKTARVTKEDLSQLAVDGILSVEFLERTVKLTFENESGVTGRVEEELQASDEIDYMQYLNIDFDEFECIEKSQFSSLTKVATSTRLTIHVIDGEAIIAPMGDEIALVGGSFIMRKKVNCPNMCVLGYHLKTMLTFDNVYLVGDGTLSNEGSVKNEIIGIKDNIIYALDQRKSMEPMYMDDILESLGEPKFTTELSFRKLSILSKNCNFKDGICEFDLSTGECTYITNRRRSVDIEMDSNFGETIILPDWLLTKIIMYYPEVLNRVVIKLYKGRLYMVTEDFDMFLTLSK